MREILIAVRSILIVFRSKVLHIGKGKRSAHQNRNTFTRDQIPAAIIVQSIELHNFFVTDYRIIGTVHKHRNADIRWCKNQKAAIFQNCRGIRVIVRIYRFFILTVKLNLKTSVQFFHRIFSQIDLNAFALGQCCLQAVLSPVFPIRFSNTDVFHRICSTVHYGDFK